MANIREIRYPLKLGIVIHCKLPRSFRVGGVFLASPPALGVQKIKKFQRQTTPLYRQNKFTPPTP